MKNTPKIGDQLAELRLASGLTQQDVADQAGVKQSYVSKIEGGHKMPSPGTLTRILSVFGHQIAFVPNPKCPVKKRLKSKV